MFEDILDNLNEIVEEKNIIINEEDEEIWSNNLNTNNIWNTNTNNIWNTNN